MPRKATVPALCWTGACSKGCDQNKRRDECGPGPGHGWGPEFLRVKSRASLGASFGLKVGFKFPHKEEMWLLARAAACKNTRDQVHSKHPFPLAGPKSLTTSDARRGTTSTFFRTAKVRSDWQLSCGALGEDRAGCGSKTRGKVHTGESEGIKTRWILVCRLCEEGEIQVTTREVEKRNEEIDGRADDRRKSIVADQTQKAEDDAGRSDECGKVDGGGYGMDRSVKIAWGETKGGGAGGTYEFYLCQTWVRRLGQEFVY